MADRRFTEMKAQAKLADAEAKRELAAAEVERAKADAERVRGETERARMKEERETRLGTEESARKTREGEAKIAADKRTVENEHLAGAIVGGLAAGKVTAKLVGKAAEKRMTKLAPEVKALAKQAKAALQGTGTKNYQLLKGIARTAPSGRGALGVGAAAVFLGDAALGFYQSGKMREQGDEDAARNLETFARANAIAGASTPLLRFDQERSASKFLDLESQATLRAAKMAAEGPAGPEPKVKRARAKPVVAKPTAEQKAIAAPEKAPVLEPKLALPVPEKVKAPTAPAKVAEPTLDEMRAAAKAAAPEKQAMRGYYKLNKQTLKVLLHENKVKIPGYGLKYAALLTAGTAAVSALMGAGTSEAKSFSGRLADAGAALKEAAPDLAEGSAETAAMMVPGGQLGVAAYETGKAAYYSEDARAVARAAASGDLKATASAAGTLAYDNTVGPAEWLMRQNAGQDFGGRGRLSSTAAPVKPNDISYPRGRGPVATATPRLPGGSKSPEPAQRMPAYHEPQPAHEHVMGYWRVQNGKRRHAEFKPETLAARANMRGGL